MTPANTAPAATLDATLQSSKARMILDAAAILLTSLAKGEALDARLLRAAMEQVTGASDADGAWCWKDAYELGSGLRSVSPALRQSPSCESQW